MKTKPHIVYSTRGLSLLLILCLMCGPMGCGEPVGAADQALEDFLNQTGAPPEPQANDVMMKGKADVIALPAISVTVWAVGALMVYIGAQEVFSNTIEDFEIVLQMALGQSASWEWAQGVNEPLHQADHLTESLSRIAYRSEGSDFYSIDGNDYLRFLTMVSPATIIDPKKLKDLLDGKVRPWGKYAKEYFAALQIASMQARFFEGEGEGTGSGLCARAKVKSLSAPFEEYVGLARAHGPIDIIPAVVLASLKATIRCGMYDSNVREFVYSYYNVGGPMDALPDIFISHMLKSAKLLHKLVDSCQMPPTIVVTLDQDDCYDVTLN